MQERSAPLLTGTFFKTFFKTASTTDFNAVLGWNMLDTRPGSTFLNYSTVSCWVMLGSLDSGRPESTLPQGSWADSAWISVAEEDFCLYPLSPGNWSFNYQKVQCKTRGKQPHQPPWTLVQHHPLGQKNNPNLARKKYPKIGQIDN